jgi:putative DNA primase/helicase
VPLQTLDGNRFSTSLLEHKLANLSADLPKKALKDTGIFKMLTGGDTLNSERKFMDVTTFENYAKLIFSANKLPSTNDDTNAFFRRWVFLMFNKRFEDKPVEGEAMVAQKDVRIKDKLTTPSELSGLLNLSLAGLERLLENSEFTSSKSIEETRKAYIKGSDPIGAFNLERIVEAAGEWVAKDEVYNKFVEYCGLFNLPSTDKQAFCKKFASLRPLEEAQKTINDRRKHGWNGIKVVKEGVATPDAPTENVVQQVLREN